LHIDSCTGEPPPPTQRPTAISTQISISSSSLLISKPIKRPDKLPHPHFDGLKDDRLRRKLTEQGLSAGGSRQALEKRYTEWVLIWNANCDSKNPRASSELKKDLDIWEKTQGDRASTSNAAHAIGLKIKDKDFDKEAWGAQNSSTFNNLIAEAKARAALRKAEQAQGSTSEPLQEGTVQAGSSSLLSLPPSIPPSESNRGTNLDRSMEPPPIPDLKPPDKLPRHASPIKSSPRFFQELSDIESSMPPPSSQYQGLMQNQDLLQE
jgi:E3 ubiquitin-protein ligase RAD18